MRPQHEQLTIVGGGIIGLLTAYFAHLDARSKEKTLHVTMHEKYPSIRSTTAVNIAPSLTPDEASSVVPPSKKLVGALQIPFNQPGGIRVDDVAGVNDSISTQKFIEAVQAYSNGPEENRAQKADLLLSLGKASMDLWQAIYEKGDDELKEILRSSNFHPCHESKKTLRELHDGYRIDLIHMENASKHAHGMKSSYYEKLGYQNCAILSPDEVACLDPSLADFCKKHSTTDEADLRSWTDDAVALWRPGGCIDTNVFLPQFEAYLKKIMKTYTDENGETKNCFDINYGKEVIGIKYNQSNTIIGLGFADTTETTAPGNYVFCTGENVSALQQLGFQTPAYTGFAGPSLKLTVPFAALSNEQKQKYEQLCHYMEVHEVGVVLAWQARRDGDNILISVAGTKAFYGDRSPKLDEAFATNRNVLQLNIINSVLPEIISAALGKDTRNLELTLDDLNQLVKNNRAKRWVGVRAVAYDGFPTIGTAHNAAGPVSNAVIATHLGSGGVSFGPIAAVTAVAALTQRLTQTDELVARALAHGNPNRTPIAPKPASQLSAAVSSGITLYGVPDPEKAAVANAQAAVTFGNG